tara:strand:+ start:22371 stop:23174 length:804 start_codon:yes stop_codon:yes gene_type:complete
MINRNDKSMKRIFFNVSFVLMGSLFLGMLSADEFNTAKSAPKVSSIIYNSSFEEGQNDDAEGWVFTSSQPPIKSGSDANSGSYSAYINLQNVGKTPSEAHIIKTVNGKFLSALNYEFTFFVKQMKKGSGGYIQQYFIEWFNEDEQKMEGTGFKQFSGKVGEWQEIVVPDVEIPDNVRSVKLLFRFVTGAIEGGSGEVFIDDVNFRADDSVEALTAAINRKVDQAQFDVALELIESFLMLHSESAQAIEIKALKSRLKKFQELDAISE